jgi:hypothetical protein
MLDGAIRFVSELDLAEDSTRGAFFRADLRGRGFVFGTLVRAMGEKKYHALATISNADSCGRIAGVNRSFERPFLCKLVRR